ncbi:hypothetical protein [Actinomadura rubrisoli]|uniref:Uncharacterized protein n=1 Tax=Actinomadura rubrisoli TaxID=2530368 RepID=A0A4R5CJN1_9ACTN|nr:hypothetical protein [Actinomadura rubrisoli]TDD97622.1 hypothetical protein E1298_00905 [Actinomadura rubrisoli]
MSNRDAENFWTGNGGHLWKTDRGPDSACARPECGLSYARWSGDRCPAAPDCDAVFEGARCGLEQGHDGDHEATLVWAS